MDFCGGKVKVFHVLTRIPTKVYIETIFKGGKFSYDGN